MRGSPGKWTVTSVLSALALCCFGQSPLAAQSLCVNGSPDGAVDAPEECDDGNTAAGDGCSDCRIEANFKCAPPVDLRSIRTQELTTDNNAEWAEMTMTEAKQLRNSDGPTIGYMPEADAFAAVYTFEIRTETAEDDDFIGFVLGYQDGEVAATSNIDYLLVDWKQDAQDDARMCPDSVRRGVARAGLAVSRVVGRASNPYCEFWEHSGVVQEIYRPADAPAGLGNQGWADNTTHRFRIRYSERSLRIDIDGVEQLNVAPAPGRTFPAGQIGFYGLSQEGVRYRAINPTAPSKCNRPPSGSDETAYFVTGTGAISFPAPRDFVEPDGDEIDGSQLRVVSAPAGVQVFGPADGEPEGQLRVVPNDANTAGRYDVVYEFCDNDPIIPLCSTATMGVIYNDPPTLGAPVPELVADGAVVTGATLMAASSVNALDGGWDLSSLMVAPALDGTYVLSAQTPMGGLCEVRDQAVYFTSGDSGMGDSCAVQLCELNPGPAGTSTTGRACGTVLLNFGVDDDGDGRSSFAECGGADLSNCPDIDGDGIPNYLDEDDDGDGIPSIIECPAADNCPDTDDDGLVDALDVDDDQDGILTAQESEVAGIDSDEDGTPDYLDTDSDGDGLPDAQEAFDADGDGLADVEPTRVDSDHDGLDDAYDPDCGTQDVCNRIVGQSPSMPDDDGDGLPDVLDIDADGDGIKDGVECAALPCVDSDSDGLADHRDLDSDDDSLSDALEGHDDDADGIADRERVESDTDGDGLDDAFDSDCGTVDDCGGVSGTTAPVPDHDSDGQEDFRDNDDDGDGIPTEQELADAEIYGEDVDDDGLPNYLDTDSDGDGMPDMLEADTDVDGDGVPDYLDPDAFPADTDLDGIPDVLECAGPVDETCIDTDGDGLLDYLDDDDDGDGVPTRDERPQGDQDTDEDGLPDHLDSDDDGDGLPTSDECVDAAACRDTDEDGLPDYIDADDDDDGIPTAREVSDGAAIGDDLDMDGLPNWHDIDSDEDGLPDEKECATPDSCPDEDDDGEPDYLDLPVVAPGDTDGDGLLDIEECTNIAEPASCMDSDGDGLPDYRDEDDDNDGLPTRVERLDGDTDQDKRPNYLDPDDDNDRVPTAVELEEGDTDNDALPDHLDVDDDGDGVPTREEEPRGDTDGDGTPDYLDVDDDGDRVSTEVELPQGDTDKDGIPDYLDVDDDNDGTSTLVEGLTSDIDADSLPDRLDPDQPGVVGGALCSVGPRTGAPWSLMLVVLAGLVLALRRRRRGLGAALWLSLVLASLGTAPTAHAQNTGALHLDRFRPAASSDDGFAINLPDTRGESDVGGFVLLEYALNPLVVEIPEGSADNERWSVVKHQLVAHAGINVALADRLMLFAGLPINLMMKGDFVSYVPTADGGGFGDPNVGLRLRLLGEPQDMFGLAVQASGTAPLARQASKEHFYSGSNGFTIWPQLLAELRGKHIGVALNAGARYQRQVRILGNLFRHELTFGLGVRVPLSETTQLYAEGYGSSYFTQLFKRVGTPFELLFGVKARFFDRMVLGVAGGPGLTRGIGSPDVRFIGTVGFVPPRKEPEPVIVDRDKDGILDVDDRCPDDPEDMDGFEDSDGCPDHDNDQDGILDRGDKCPLDPEDKDDFEDNDGCPDPDNDQDGVLDVDDKCINQPGEAVYDGCPPPDRDGDGVLDADDNCPDRKGLAEYNGCPEAPKAILRAEKIELLEKVHFATNKDEVLPESFGLLDEVAQVLTSHPNVALVRIEGHTDDRGNADHNRELSQRRADTVKRHLVARGVDAERLIAVGYGEDTPIDSNASRDGRAANRRVEFNIVDSNTTP